jgi:hypothetical protein
MSEDKIKWGLSYANLQLYLAAIPEMDIDEEVEEKDEKENELARFFKKTK